MFVACDSCHTFYIACTIENQVQRKKRVRVANGQIVTRDVGFAIIRLREHFTTDEVVLAGRKDLQLLGARTLEGLNLRVDSRKKKLVAGGPLPAA